MQEVKVYHMQQVRKILKLRKNPPKYWLQGDPGNEARLSQHEDFQGSLRSWSLATGHARVPNPR